MVRESKRAATGKRPKWKRGIAAICCCLSVAGAAQAATYSFSYTKSDGTLLAYGALGTSDTLNGRGGYDITSISGSVTGYGAITGLIADPYAPTTAYYFIGTGTVAAADPDNLAGYFFDNILYPNGNAALDGDGLAFMAGGTAINIFAPSVTSGASPYDLVTPGVTTNYADHPGAFSIASVPESATWAMMICGFGMIGAVLRQRRTRIAFA